jgi:uncharacterized protein (UPF0147 family)
VIKVSSGDSNKLNEVISALNELCEDNTVPRNIKIKLQGMIALLNDTNKNAVKVNKVLHDLDEINEDVNLQPYIRTQIWNLVSMLEKV